jgi:hypothetical protein
MKWVRRLRGLFGYAIAPGNIAQRQLRDFPSVGRRLRLLLGGTGLSLVPGIHGRFIFGSQNLRAPQIFIGVHVLRFVLLILASAFLSCGFGHILRGGGTALCCAGK